MDREASASPSSRTSYSANEPPRIEHTHTEAARVSTKAVAYNTHEAANMSATAALESIWADRSSTRNIAKSASARKSSNRAKRSKKIASSRIAVRASIWRKWSVGPLVARKRIRSSIANNTRRDRKDRSRRSRTLARAVTSESSYERSEKTNGNSTRLSATAIALREAVSRPKANSNVASAMDNSNSSASNSVERANNTREVRNIRRKRLLHTRTNKSYPRRSTAASTTYAANYAKRVHTKASKLTYYRATSSDNPATTKASRRDRRTPRINSYSRSPTNIVADSAEKISSKASLRVEESDPSIRSRRGHVVVDRATTVLHRMYHTTASASNRVRRNRNTSSTSSEASWKLRRTKNREARSRRRLYTSKRAEEMAAASRNYRMVANVKIRNPERSLHRAVREESAARSNLRKSNYMVSYNKAANEPSSSRPRKRIASKAMSDADAEERRHMINVYRSVASSSDSSKTIEAELSNRSRSASSRSRNTKVARKRYPSYTAKSMNSTSDPPMKSEAVLLYISMARPRKASPSVPDKMANIAKSNLLAAIDDLVLVARAGKIRKNSTAMGKSYSGSADTEHISAASSATPRKDPAEPRVRSAVTYSVRSSSYPDIVARYKRMSERSARSKIHNSPKAPTKTRSVASRDVVHNSSPYTKNVVSGLPPSSEPSESVLESARSPRRIPKERSAVATRRAALSNEALDTNAGSLPVIRKTRLPPLYHRKILDNDNQHRTPHTI